MIRAKKALARLTPADMAYVGFGFGCCISAPHRIVHVWNENTSQGEPSYASHLFINGAAEVAFDSLAFWIWAKILARPIQPLDVAAGMSAVLVAKFGRTPDCAVSLRDKKWSWVSP
jgi:hypothetical protein